MEQAMLSEMDISPQPLDEEGQEKEVSIYIYIYVYTYIIKRYANRVPCFFKKIYKNTMTSALY